jgi:hypothetical protein
MADRYGSGHACRFYRVILELLELTGATQGLSVVTPGLPV